jgi:hypothetical protein
LIPGHGVASNAEGVVLEATAALPIGARLPFLDTVYRVFWE